MKEKKLEFQLMAHDGCYSYLRFWDIRAPYKNSPLHKLETNELKLLNIATK